MSTSHDLKKARALIVAGARDLYRAVELSTTTSDEQLAALEALELQATPARHALDQAIKRWIETHDNEHGRIALKLARAPGADGALWNWINAPTRTKGEVLKLFDRAINKAQRSGS